MGNILDCGLAKTTLSAFRDWGWGHSSRGTQDSHEIRLCYTSNDATSVPQAILSCLTAAEDANEDALLYGDAL